MFFDTSWSGYVRNCHDKKARESHDRGSHDEPGRVRRTEDGGRRPGGPDLLQKTIQNNNFQNRFSSLVPYMGWLWEAIWDHVGGIFAAKNGAQK